MFRCYQFYIISVLLFSIAACQAPVKRRNAEANEQHSPSAVKKIPNKSPSPTIIEGIYHPNQDDKNKPSFTLKTKRNADDPGDAKKKALDVKTLFRIQSSQDVQLSADGKTLLFTKRSTNIKKGKTSSAIYIVATDGSKPARSLTGKKHYNMHPRWSADQNSFYFLSTRSGSMQIWRMSLQGGDPTQITDFSMGVEEFYLSPRNKTLAFVSSVYPKHGANSEANAKENKRRKDNPLKAYLADDLYYRHWTEFREGKRKHVIAFDLARFNRDQSRHYQDLSPGDYDSPSRFSDHGIAFSPDGKEVAFVSNRPKNKSEEAYSTNKDIWIVKTTGGQAINITKTNPAFDGHPQYSPNGRYLAFLRQKNPGHESDRFQLALYDRKTKKTIILANRFDNWILGYQWTDDSQSLLCRVAIKGRFPLILIDQKNSVVHKLSLPGVRSFDLKNKQLAFTYHSVDQPLEVYRAILENKTIKKLKRLTFFNKEITEQYDLRPVEEVFIEGANQKKVHTFIVKPHGFKKNKRYPLIINVHGGPQYQWADTFRGDWQIYPAAGYVVAYFNPHGSIGYGQDYTSAISKDYSGKVFEDIEKVTEYLSKLPYVDKDRIGAMGWSWGGYAMAWLAGHSTRYKALAAMMPVYDLRSFYGATEELFFPEWDIGKTPWENPKAYEKFSPSSYAAKFKTPTLVITGEKDYRVPYTQGLQFFTALRRQHIDARLIVLKHDGHWPNLAKSMPLYYVAHLDWFHRYLGGKKPTLDVKAMVEGRAFQ